MKWTLKCQETDKLRFMLFKDIALSPAARDESTLALNAVLSSIIEKILLLHVRERHFIFVYSVLYVRREHVRQVDVL